MNSFEQQAIYTSVEIECIKAEYANAKATLRIMRNQLYEQAADMNPLAAQVIGAQRMTPDGDVFPTGSQMVYFINITNRWLRSVGAYHAS